MATMTITEALADLKTIAKRRVKIEDFIKKNIARQKGLVDPFEKEEDGSRGEVKRKIQSLGDLNERVVKIRRSIRHANAETVVKVGSRSRSIDDWLTWRRDVSGHIGSFLTQTASGINSIRTSSKQQGRAVVSNAADAPELSDVVVHLDEKWLQDEIENHEVTLGDLDGKLSLVNATTMVTIED
jgi:hypothetical protein